MYIQYRTIPSLTGPQATVCKKISVALAQVTERVLLHLGSRDTGLFGYTLFHLALQDLRQNPGHTRGEVREEIDLRKRLPMHAVNEATTYGMIGEFGLRNARRVTRTRSERTSRMTN